MKKILRGLKIFRKIRGRRVLKINVGSAGINFSPEWIATDIDTLDITKTTDWLNILLYLKADYIMAEHVWEHLTVSDTKLANKNCHRFLKRGGKLRLAVPDGFNPDPDYINYVKPGGYGAGAEDHKVLYNYKLMTTRLQKAGFKVKLLEYWDEDGKFHFEDWRSEEGHIMRSKRYDKRNQEGKLGYTSLIVDAIKE